LSYFTHNRCRRSPPEAHRRSLRSGRPSLPHLEADKDTALTIGFPSTRGIPFTLSPVLEVTRMPPLSTPCTRSPATRTEP
jgi:hypothetical protein